MIAVFHLNLVFCILRQPSCHFPKQIFSKDGSKLFIIIHQYRCKEKKSLLGKCRKKFNGRNLFQNIFISLGFWVFNTQFFSFLESISYLFSILLAPYIYIYIFKIYNHLWHPDFLTKKRILLNCELATINLAVYI